MPGQSGTGGFSRVPDSGADAANAACTVLDLVRRVIEGMPIGTICVVFEVKRRMAELPDKK